MHTSFTFSPHINYFTPPIIHVDFISPTPTGGCGTNMHHVGLLLSQGRFTLWWRSPLVLNYRGISKIWLAESDTLVRWWFTLRPTIIWWRTLYMDAKVTTLFLRGGSQEVKLLGQPQSLGQETWPPENSDLNRIFYCLFIFSWIPSLASKNHVLG